MRIALLGCKGTTLDLLDNIVSRNSFSVDLVITLPQAVAEKNHVAYYRGHEIVDYCKQRGITDHLVRSYDLRDPEDIRFFHETEIDLLMVIGWERLIPDDVLGTLGRFACGMHGSPYGLPKGRGRSPLNWSIITGHHRFMTYLFRYNALTDDGEIIGSRVFDVNPFDTIATLHMKNRIAMYHLLEMYLPLVENDQVVFYPQPPGTVTFYPKRAPEDSGIDWFQSTRQVYDLVRAVAPPYPPAFCYHGEKKLYILEAYPFESGMFHHSIEPGTVVDVSISLESFAVKTLDGTLIVRKFSGAGIADLGVGDVLQGVSQNDIIEQIRQRYPEDLADDQKEI